MIRIYAENGFKDFRPSTGIINEMIVPQGLGVRFDDGIRVGQNITPYYDSLLGKLITWGKNRQLALSRMSRALHEFHVSGIETTIPFCKTLLLHPLFKKGTYCTHTLNDIQDDLLKKITQNKKEYLLAARIGATKLHGKNKIKFMPNEISTNNWLNAGRKDAME